VQGISESTEVNAPGVYGLINSTTPASGSAGVRGHNNSTGVRGYGVYGSHAGIGVGVYGQSPNGLGVYGSGARGGSFAGTIGVGLEGYSPKDDGVRASSSAANKSGLWAHHDGSNYGYGLFAQSAVGPAIGMSGPDSAPPITLNGKPFPSVTAGFKNTGVTVPHDSAFHPIASLNVGPGTYAIIAKADVRNAAATEEAVVRCVLGVGGDQDESAYVGSDVQSVSFALFHHSPSAGAVTLSCLAYSNYHSAYVSDTKIVAIRVAGGTNAAMP
jgi:hypothetical protein